MPQVKCKICNHPEAATINRQLSQGRSLRDVSGQYDDVSLPSMARHSKNCLRRTFDEGQKPQRGGRITKEPTKLAQSRVAESLSPKARLEAMIGDVEEVMEAAKASGDLRLMVMASRELRPIVEAVAKLEAQGRNDEDEARQKMYRVFAALPQSFIDKLRAEDNEAPVKALCEAAGFDADGNPC